MNSTPASPIRIAAAVIFDAEGRLLLVKKRGTIFFMQPGSKLEPAETPAQTLARELREELGCTLRHAEFLGNFSAPAANEPSHIVEAQLFRAEIEGSLAIGSEIEEMLWVDPSQTGDLSLAPLTKDHILPFICGRSARSAS
ncbi:MAG TPA: NUDIX domain-containing protein [Candidatus Acidoferrum sp.]|nr:NUDIX domain-containing protein [Candidatus Acidoferrum sp.]